MHNFFMLFRRKRDSVLGTVTRAWMWHANVGQVVNDPTFFFLLSSSELGKTDTIVRPHMCKEKKKKETQLQNPTGLF